MHVRSFGILAVIAAGIAAACNGGGGNAPNGRFGPGEYEAPPDSYDAPGSPFDQPPAGDDTPPSDFDEPPDSGGSGSSTRACNSICRSLAANGCEQGNLDPASCVLACSEGLAEAYDVCLDELLGVLDCVFRSPNFDCSSYQEGEVDERVFAGCEVDALEFSRCAEQNPPDQGPGPGGGDGGAGNL